MMDPVLQMCCDIQDHLLWLRESAQSRCADLVFALLDRLLIILPEQPGLRLVGCVEQWVEETVLRYERIMPG